MAIKSGTLRRRLNESIDINIICKVQLILMLAYIRQYNNSICDSLQNKENLLKKILIEKENMDLQRIDGMVSRITPDFIPSPEQAKRFFGILGKNCTYQSGFIKASLLRCLDNPASDKDIKNNKSAGIVKKRLLDAKQLKQYIYKARKIEYVLKKIGCHDITYKLNSNGDNFYSCSNKSGDNSKAVIVFDNQLLNVVNHTRKIPGYDIFALVQHNMNLTFPQALKFLHQILGLSDINISHLDLSTDTKEEDPDENEEDERKERLEREKIYKKALEKDLKIYHGSDPIQHIQWLREGILPDIAVNKFGTRYNYLNNSIIIPIRHYETGEIVAITQRNMQYFDNPEVREMLGVSKYCVTKGYNKNANIYGFFENVKSIKEAGVIVIFEAEKSVLKRSTMVDNTGVAIQGHNLSEAQTEIIASLNLDEITIAFDKDVSVDEVRFYCERLLNQGCRKVSYIFDKWDLLGKKDSPADAKDKIYQYLFKHRVTYDESEHKKYLESMKKR